MSVNKQSRKINYELIISVSAVFMSLLAVIVSIQQTKIAREQQKSSMWPHLETYNTHPDSNSYSMILVNQGVGPAIINDSKFIFEKDTIFDFSDLFEKNLIYNGLYSDLWKGRILQAGQSIELVTFKHEAAIDHFNQYIGKNMKTIKINYSSIYGDCWELIRMENGFFKTEKLGVCNENLGY
jgi:hypothetical protein